MAKTDLGELTDDELRDMQHELSAQRKALKARQLEIVAELDRRAVVAKMGNLNQSELNALRQVIAARGIESGEAVGTPGR